MCAYRGDGGGGKKVGLFVNRSEIKLPIDREREREGLPGRWTVVVTQ